MTETIIEPELPIIDPHHHLWDLRPLMSAFPEPRHDFLEAIAGAPYYTFDELHADTHSFPNALRSVLREDPDVVLIGEMRDLETIESALRIASPG